MRSKCSLLLAILLAWPAGLHAAPNADQAVPDDVRKLIEQLGDNQYAKREEAVVQLKAIGKPALPALKQAIERNEDPEIVSRAQALVKRIEIRPVPGIDPNAANGQVQAMRVQMSVKNDGTQVLQVTENGRDIKMSEGADGIVMSVTGFVEGERATEEYTAKNLAQLKEENPAAAALYERCFALAAGPGVMMGRQIQVRGGGVVQFNVQNIPDELELLRARIEKQMREQKLKPVDREAVNKGLDELTEARHAGAAGMEKYTDQCDEFRKTLEKYKLDPGELLPPPARSRLGISVATADGHLFVQNVSDKSRAERIGLKPGDLIRKVDGKDVASVGDLRKATIANEKGMILEITRDGAEVKLEEKKK